MATNKPVKLIAPILAPLEIARYFSIIIGGDSLSQKKPHPLPLFHICEQLKITPKDAVIIGDSKNDMLAGKAAEMETVGVTYGYNYGIPIARHKPTVIISDFAELQNYF